MAGDERIGMTSPEQSFALFRRRVVASVLLPSGVFCLALIISLTLLRYLWEANRAVSHSDLVLAQTNETFRRVATSQSVARGYLLYHRPRFLESYRESKEKLGVELGELAQLTADNGQQQAALQLLVPRLKSLLEFSDRALETEREGKHALWKFVTASISFWRASRSFEPNVASILRTWWPGPSGLWCWEQLSSAAVWPFICVIC